VSKFEAWLRAAERYCISVDEGHDFTLRGALNSQMITAFHEYRCSDEWRELDATATAPARPVDEDVPPPMELA
jgi:hypothetical protein